MKIPLTPYEFGHVRKALSAGVLALGAAVGTALTNHVAPSTLITWPAVGGLAGAFLAGALGTFWTKNKTLEAEILTVIEDVDPALVPIVDPILGAASQPTMTVTSSASSTAGQG